MSDKEAYARHLDVLTRTPAGIIEHWCDHPGCKRWGCFGFPTRVGTSWFCGEHRGDPVTPLGPGMTADENDTAG
jgi:hypothetical protein